MVWLSFLFSLHPWLKGTRRDLTNSEVMCVKILNYKEKSFKVLKSTMTAVSMSNHILYNYQGSFFFFLIRSRPKYTFIMRPRKRRANVVKNTQLERNRLQSLKIDNSQRWRNVAIFCRTAWAILRWRTSCQICYTYLATDSSCLEV